MLLSELILSKVKLSFVFETSNLSSFIFMFSFLPGLKLRSAGLQLTILFSPSISCSYRVHLPVQLGVFWTLGLVRIRTRWPTTPPPLCTTIGTGTRQGRFRGQDSSYVSHTRGTPPNQLIWNGPIRDDSFKLEPDPQKETVDWRLSAEIKTQWENSIHHVLVSDCQRHIRTQSVTW